MTFSFIRSLPVGPSGEHLNSFGAPSISGGQLLDPIAIAIDSSGDVWIANYLGGEGDARRRVLG